MSHKLNYHTKPAWNYITAGYGSCRDALYATQGPVRFRRPTFPSIATRRDRCRITSLNAFDVRVYGGFSYMLPKLHVHLGQ